MDFRSKAYHLGFMIAQKETDVSLKSLSNNIYKGLDYTDFDYEGGERDMVEAAIIASMGYVTALGMHMFVEKALADVPQSE